MNQVNTMMSKNLFKSISKGVDLLVSHMARAFVNAPLQLLLTS